MGSTARLLVTVVLLAVATTYPSSLVLAAARKGRTAVYGLLGALAAAAFALGGAGTAAWMLSLFGASGMGLVWGLRRFRNVEGAFLAAWTATMLALALDTALTVRGLGIGLGDLTAFLDQDMGRTRAYMQSLGVVSEEQWSVIETWPDGWLRMMFAVTPSVYGVLAALMIGLNLVTVARYAAPGQLGSDLGDFAKWSAPQPLVFGVLAPGAFLAVSALAGNPKTGFSGFPGFLGDWPAQALAWNVLALAMVPFFFQGMAIFAHTLRRFRLGPGGRMLAYLLALGLFGLMIVPAMALAGVLDIWLDWRRPGPRAAEPDEGERRTDDEGD